MLVDVVGINGSGKTFIMTFFVLCELNKNAWANYHIKHPKFHYLELEDFLQIPDNTNVVIDEAYTWLESRRSMKSTNIYVSHIKEQKRKTDSTWYVSEQYLGLIDKRFEEFCDVLIQCKPRYPIGHSMDDFEYKITYMDTKQVVHKIFLYEEAKQYFSYFNTKEKVKPENIQKVEFDIIKNKPKKLKAKVLEHVKTIENDLEIYDYTHATLKYACYKHDIIQDYEPFLHIYFTQKVKIEKEKEKSKNHGGI